MEEKIENNPNIETRPNSHLALWSIFGGGLMGAIAFILFWKQGFGLNIFLFTIGTVGFVQLTKFVINRKFYFSGWDLFQIIFLVIAFGSVINDSLSMDIVKTVLFFLFFPVFGFLAIYPETIKRFSFINSSALYIQQLISPFVSIPDFVKSSFRFKPGRIVTPNSLKIVIGIIIALPIVCVLTILLMNADEAFQMIIKSIINSINTFIKEVLKFENIWDVLLLIIAIIAGIFISLGYVFARLKIQLHDFTYEQMEKGLDLVVSNVVIAGINFLFLVFVIIQFQYLFFGGERISDLGLTYSEYARRGFAELQLVSLIVFSIIYILIRFGKKSSKLVTNITSVNMTLLLLNTLIIVFSALLRLNLYMDVYGYTLLRFYPYVFMIYQFFVFLYLIPSLYSRKIFKHFSLFAFSLFLIFVTTLSLISPERIVVYKNIAKSEETGFLDVNYILRLSSDGLTVFLDKKGEEYNSELILCQIIASKNRRTTKMSWQDFSYSKYKFAKYWKESNFSIDGNKERCNEIVKKEIEEAMGKYAQLIKNEQFDSAFNDYWFEQYTPIFDEIEEDKFVITNVTYDLSRGTYGEIDWTGLYPNVTNKYKVVLDYQVVYTNGTVKCFPDNVDLVIQNGEVKFTYAGSLPLGHGRTDVYSGYYSNDEFAKEQIQNFNKGIGYGNSICISTNY